MRKTYDLDSPLHPSASLAKDVAYSRYMELTRSSESKSVDAQSVATLLVEPNTLLREGLKRILAETTYSPVASAPSLEEAQSLWTPGQNPFLLIMDAARDHEEACRLVQQLKEEQPSGRAVLLVEQYELKQVLAAFDAGADAYLIKSISCEVLVKTLDLVTLGETVFPSAVLDLVRDYEANMSETEDAQISKATDEDNPPAKGLSVRETVILRCLMEGDSNKIIARKFEITEATVKVHVKAILRKIRAKNRTQAAIWASSHLPASGQVPTS
jgi:two-component system nitrate/nitrite response regulator NarL